MPVYGIYRTPVDDPLDANCVVRMARELDAPPVHPLHVPPTKTRENSHVGFGMFEIWNVSPTERCVLLSKRGHEARVRLARSKPITSCAVDHRSPAKNSRATLHVRFTLRIGVNDATLAQPAR